MFRGKFIDIVLENEGFLRGPFGSALKKSLFVQKAIDTYKVYEQSVVLEKNKNLGDYYISKEYFESNMKNFEVKSGDFLVSCSGVNYGEIYELEGIIEKGVINQALLRIRINEKIVDRNYFLYYFRAYIAKVITGGTGDSTIPNFPPMDFVKNVQIELPNIEIQREIGKILKKIDEKIIFNNQINNNLEELAYTIFLHSFSNKTSNGTIGEIIKENKKSKIKVGDAKDITGEYPFFTSGESILEWNDYLVDGRHLFLNTGGNADVKFYVGKSMYSTDTWCITTNKDLSDYLYLYFKSIREEMDRKFFHGSGLKHLQKPLLKKEKIYIPEKEELANFNVQVKPMFDTISSNKIENKKLNSLKEYLLPLLMNGQINVDDIEI